MGAVLAELAVLTALRIEALAVRRKVTVTGMGRTSAINSTTKLAGRLDENTVVGIAGVAGALDPDLRPGQVVVATELLTTDGAPPRVLSSALVVAADLRRAGLDVRCGPIVSVPTYARGRQRAELAATGAVAVDMESAWMVGSLGDRPIVVVRAISDTADQGPVVGGLSALAALTRVRPTLERWARTCRPRSVVLGAPRSFCAGVDRAIDTVERSLARFGSPVYVRRQIVHNSHVVSRLEGLGAVFVEELDEVPDGATVVLAAHGVSPEVHRQAADRATLRVVDATCPLVSKVHHEARQFASRGLPIVLIGHADHEEVQGTLGEAPGNIRLVERPEDVASLDIDPSGPVAYLSQTTLATDETDAIVELLGRRFAHLIGPKTQDVCYATDNRQDAVRSMAQACDLVLVVGSANSSNTLRLVEVARREGCRAERIEDHSQLRLEWLDGVATVGITAGASAPEILVQQLIDSLGSLGPLEVSEHRTRNESIHFSLPKQVR